MSSSTYIKDVGLSLTGGPNSLYLEVGNCNENVKTTWVEIFYQVDTGKVDAGGPTSFGFLSSQKSSPDDVFGFLINLDTADGTNSEWEYRYGPYSDEEPIGNGEKSNPPVFPDESVSKTFDMLCQIQFVGEGEIEWYLESYDRD